MAMNPMDMMKFAGRLKIFQDQHPRMIPFLQNIGANAIMPGAIVEMKVTAPDGKEYISNIRVTEEDVETIRMMREMGQNQ